MHFTKTNYLAYCLIRPLTPTPVAYTHFKKTPCVFEPGGQPCFRQRIGDSQGSGGSVLNHVPANMFFYVLRSLNLTSLNTCLNIREVKSNWMQKWNLYTIIDAQIRKLSWFWHLWVSQAETCRRRWSKWENHQNALVKHTPLIKKYVGGVWPFRMRG